jgi:hypothetical protein
MNFKIEKVIPTANIEAMSGFDFSEFNDCAFILTDENGLMGVYIPQRNLFYMQDEDTPHLSVVE